MKLKIDAPCFEVGSKVVVTVSKAGGTLAAKTNQATVRGVIVRLGMAFLNQDTVVRLEGNNDPDLDGNEFAVGQGIDALTLE